MLSWTRRPTAAYDQTELQSQFGSTESPRAMATIRGALIAGFTVVFALWLISGYELVRSIGIVERDVEAAQSTFLKGEQALSMVTTRVLLGSIYLRDALMTSMPEQRDRYRRELLQIRQEVEEALPLYLPLVNTPLEREQWDRLQVELDRYWKSREVAFTLEGQDLPGSAATRTELIQSRLAPARESILQIVDSLSALERASIDNHQAEAAQVYRNAQSRILWLASVALIAGIAVAFVAARHVGRLQREIELQRLIEQQNRRDLERLSARLVTAQEEERRSLARELHDAVGQALTAIKMEMGVAVRGIDADSRARGALDQARAIAESTLQNVRDLSQLLHPSMLDDFGLPEALRAHFRSFSKRTGIRAQLTHERMDERLPPEVEVCVYRIVQEALTNVARHSGASSCTVSLVRRDGLLHLTIEDDGRGLSPALPRMIDARRGLGLIGMRERAQALAGSFIIENRAEGGTRVVVRLPVPMTATEPAAAPQQLAG